MLQLFYNKPGIKMADSKEPATYVYRKIILRNLYFLLFRFIEKE
jgi:hypothetical protein